MLDSMYHMTGPRSAVGNASGYRCAGPLVEPLKPLETFNLVAIL